MTYCSQSLWATTYTAETDSGQRPINIFAEKDFPPSVSRVMNQFAYFFTKCRTLSRDGREWYYITEKKLAQKIGLCERTVRYAISTLIKLGFIICKRFSNIYRGTVNCYSIVCKTKDSLEDKSRKGTSLSEAENEGVPEIQGGKNCLLHKERVYIFNNISSNEDIEEDIYNYTDRKYSQSNQSSLTSNLENILHKMESLPSELHQPDLQAMKEEEAEGSPNAVAVVSEPVVSRMKDSAGTAPMRISEQMIQVLNTEVVAHKRNMAPYVTAKYYVSELKSAWDGPLERNMDEWRAVCRAVRCSNWMMSDAFTLTLSWLLKHDTLEQIRQGKFGCRYVRPAPSFKVAIARALEYRQQAIDSIDNVQEGKEQKALRQALMEELGPGAYLAWFASTSITANRVVLCQTPHQLSVIASRYAHVLEKHKLTVRMTGEPDTPETALVDVAPSTSQWEELKAMLKKPAALFGCGKPDPLDNP